MTLSTKPNTPMGSPVSPTIADMVLQEIENEAAKSLQLAFYFRYVDDILLATQSDKLQETLDVFNSFHERMQFTMEESENDQQQRRRRKFKHRINYFEELDDVDFKMRFRLNKQSVLLVLEEIRGELEFLTNRNHAVSPMEQLLLTLRIYATGLFLITMGDFSGVSTTSAHYIIHRVSAAIARLRPRYIQFPSTEEKIRKEQLCFYNIAAFPRVIGCMDCTHVHTCGENAELFRNRKDYFSLNVQAVCNSNLEITNVVARWQGSVHDSTIFNNSRLPKSGHAMEDWREHIGGGGFI
ncbi:PREDICTED: putative nuclease HARBI1 [Wasmannia auropunctata]|uniref:putative nuclease HARBI1 n=1 Tax=Wasmannia auropunctata TaxID=64793 RepID=UPI0005F03F5C|nr:PREDICTED: putative nuclease HARBI1 [Wasmannia auropunctata]